MRHFLVEFGHPPTCVEATHCILYEQLQHCLPSPQELDNLIERSMRMSEDPEQFFMDDKIYVPTENLEKLKEETPINKDVYCVLCQHEFAEGQTCYTLTPCGHQFHSNGDDCLDGSSIIDWLSEHKTCPMCKVEIVIPSGMDDTD